MWKAKTETEYRCSVFTDPPHLVIEDINDNMTNVLEVHDKCSNRHVLNGFTIITSHSTIFYVQSAIRTNIEAVQKASVLILMLKYHKTNLSTKYTLTMFWRAIL